MIEFNNLTEVSVDEKKISKIAEKILEEEKASKKNISIAFIGKNAIKELNRKYRNKDKMTDELSFIYDKNFGEIVICPELSKNITRSLIHGILHLLGYDHEKNKKRAEEMEKKEKYYLSQLKG